MLIADGHDVLPAVEVDPRSSDEDLMALALAEGRVLITEDKDFGELAFARGLPTPCVVRLTAMSDMARTYALLDLINDHTEALRDGTLIVVSSNRVRIRIVEPFSRN